MNDETNFEHQDFNVHNLLNYSHFELKYEHQHTYLTYTQSLVCIRATELCYSEQSNKTMQRESLFREKKIIGKHQCMKVESAL